MSTIAVKNNYQETTPKGTLSWKKDELIVPPETNVAGFELRFTAFVNATAAAAGGMATAAQQALLEALETKFEEAVSTKFKNAPINKETIYQLWLDGKATLERDAVGGIGSTDGLKMALAVGANEVPFTIPISLAHLEPIDESRRVGAMGYSQLLDSAFSVKVGAEPLNAADANVTLTKLGLDLRVIPADDSIGDAECPPVSIVQVQGGAKNQVAGPDGLTFRADQTGALSANTIEKMDVTVGGKPDTVEGSPEDVQFRLERAPDSGTQETSLSTYRTPLYALADMPFNKVRTGPLKVDMGTTHYADLDVRIIHKPLWNDEEVRARIARRAERLEDGQYVHAIASHEAEKCDVEPNQAPFTGMTYLTTDDPRFHTTIGQRCKKGGQPFVHVPTRLKLQMAMEYRMALADTSGGDENTAAANAVAVIIKYGMECPAFVTSSAGAPPVGGASRVFGQLKAITIRTLAQMDAAAAGQEPPPDLTERELQ